MAAPVIASQTTSALVANQASFTLTKPTGLAVGNTLVAIVTSLDVNGSAVDSPTAPGGWTTVTDQTASGDRVTIFSKVADSADVAASNFTFNTDSTSASTGGILYRVTGAVSFQTVTAVTDLTNNTTYTSGTISHSLFTDSISMMVVLGDDSDSTTSSISGYSATGATLTYTEVFDTTLDNGTRSHTAGFANATYTGSPATITNFSATYDSSATQGFGLLLNLVTVVSPTVDVSHLSVTPSISGVTATQVNVTIPVSFISTTPALFGFSVVNSSDRTQWTNSTKENTEWTNQPIA